MIREARFDEAIAACGEAIRLRPDYADAYTQLGIALVAQQHRPPERQSPRSERRFGSIQVMPRPISPWETPSSQSTGLGEHDDRRFDEVVREYREAAPPQSTVGRCLLRGLGKLLSKLGRFDEAIEAYQQATRADYAARDSLFRP